MPPRSSIVSRLRVRQISYCSVKPSTSKSDSGVNVSRLYSGTLGRAQLRPPCRAQGVKARSQAQSSRCVHQRVEHLQAVMAHADGVGVGKGQAQLAADLRDGPCGPRSARPPDTGRDAARRGNMRSATNDFSRLLSIKSAIVRIRRAAILGAGENLTTNPPIYRAPLRPATAASRRPSMSSAFVSRHCGPRRQVRQRWQR